MVKGIKVNKLGITFHVLSGAILALSVLLAFLRFESVFQRVLSSGKDFGLSIAYYCTEMFQFHVITPTVNEIPKNAIEILPFDPAVFKAKLKVFGKELVTWANVELYFQDVLHFLLKVCEIAMPVITGLVLVVVLVKSKQPEINNNDNEDTKALRIYKKIEAVTWEKVKLFLRLYIDFLRIYPKYVWGSLCIWAYNLNVITIALEVFAYAFYLSFSLDFLHLYTLVAKIAMDATVAVDFLPGVVWVVIGWLIFDYLRKKAGMEILYGYEAKNREFLENHLGALFVVGKQRAKKTTIITDMGLSQEQIFRDNAFKGMMDCTKQFPFFPWQNVQRFSRYAYKIHALPTLESCRRFIRKLYLHHKYRERYKNNELMREFLQYWYKIRYGYAFENFNFDYENEKYGEKFNDGLTMVNVFECLSDYLQQLYIYGAPTPLIFGNYSTRTDLVWTDYGNMKVYDGDFFNRNPEEIEKISQYSHIGIMDSMRLGKLDDENNPFKDAFEVGVWTEMEHAKERGNQITNRQYTDAKEDKKKEAEGEKEKPCTPLNDGYELNLKMQGHASTIAFYTYFRLFIDDQRPDSLGADNRDLCDVIKIESTSDAKVVVPFFFLDEILHFLVGKLYDERYVDEAVHRSDNTLPTYLLKKLCMPVFRYIKRVKNQYSVYTAKLKVWDGQTEKVIKEGEKYYICKKKTYSKRFATDGIKDFYSKKAARSSLGLNDFPQFRSVQMGVDEMRLMGSHFYKRIDRVFGVKRGETSKNAA